MTPDEEWRSVEGFPMYEVSNLGRVRSWIAHMGRPVPHLIKPGLSTNGYEQISVRNPGDLSSRRTVGVHRLVATAFLGPRPGPPRQVHVCHNDGDKRNNRVENLRYDTAQANVADLVEEGRHSSVYESQRTECPRGHPYTPENTGFNRPPEKKPTRYCRTCKNARDRARRERRRSEAAQRRAA